MSALSHDDLTLLTTLRAAEVSKLGIDSALIGALALAVHGYTRATEDADLATDVDPFTQLKDAARVLQDAGFNVEFATPDSDDTLGGVITISGDDFDPIQIVNFYNPLRPGLINPGADAVRFATPQAVGDGTLRVVDLPHLIALN